MAQFLAVRAERPEQWQPQGGIEQLRALRDLRRYAPTVMIQNAGQVNIGSQQVNLAE